MDKGNSIEINGVRYVVKDIRPIPKNVHGSFDDLPITETNDSFLMRMINGTPEPNHSELDQDKK